jgi:hypothetical protein
MKNGTGDNGSRATVPESLPVRFVRGGQYIEVTLQFELEDHAITGLCPELGTSAFGSDGEEAVEALIEAVILQLEALEDAGELERFLRENDVPLRTEKATHWNPVNPRLVTA